MNGYDQLKPSFEIRFMLPIELTEKRKERVPMGCMKLVSNDI